MKKSHKLIVALVFITIVLLIIFLSKDFIIRKYFISKLENVDYDEYILELSINGKKNAIYYYTPEYVMERNYDTTGKLYNFVITKEFNNYMEHYYYISTQETISNPINSQILRTSNINNELVLYFLKNENETDIKKFRYRGIQNINNRKCYVLQFINKNNIINTIYLDKELLYTVKIDSSPPNNNYTIYEYNLDLSLTQKSLFKFNK